MQKEKLINARGFRDCQDYIFRNVVVVVDDAISSGFKVGTVAAVAAVTSVTFNHNVAI